MNLPETKEQKILLVKMNYEGLKRNENLNKKCFKIYVMYDFNL